MIVIDIRSNKAMYEQIIEQVKYNVLKGYLKKGDAMPSVRKLAFELSVTPGTVARAYQELERQKVIQTIRGKGAFISADENIKPNEDKLSDIKKVITAQLIDLKYMGFNENEVTDIVRDIYRSLD